MSNEGFQKTMATKEDGVFTIGLKCLQLQLKNLLEGVGGEHASELLDAVSTLGIKEQKLMLNVFTAVTKKIAGNLEEERRMTSDDAALKELEDSLYREIMEAFESDKSEAHAIGSVRRKAPLSLINGKKEVTSTPLDFNKALKARRPKDSALN